MLLWLRSWIVTGSLFFATLVGIIRAQPWQPLPLDTTPNTNPECSTGCFMGIRVGYTTAEEAAAILSQHPWVARVNTSEYGIRWDWSGSQPAYIASTSPGWISTQATIVEGLLIITNTTFGDWVLQWGTPSDVVAEPVSMGDLSGSLWIRMIFEEPRIFIRTAGSFFHRCDLMTNLWHVPVALEVPLPSFEMRSNPRTLDDWMQFFEQRRTRHCQSES